MSKTCLASGNYRGLPSGTVTLDLKGKDLRSILGREQSIYNQDSGRRTMVYLRNWKKASEEGAQSGGGGVIKKKKEAAEVHRNWILQELISQDSDLNM